jgi:peptide/nickel transport system permease protein
LLEESRAETSTLVLEREMLPPRRAWWRRGITLAVRKPLGTISAIIIVAIVGAAVLAPVGVARYDPEDSFWVYDEEMGREVLIDKAAPSGGHWLGTDDFGRDIYSRIIWGSQRSLQIGLLSLLMGTAIGVVLAFMSAYARGNFDLFFQRIMDAFQAFPPLLFLMLMVTITEPTVRWLIIALGVVSVPSVSRIVRSVILQTREMPYVEAARAIGASAPRIMVRHILPNITAPIIIVFSMGIGVVILAEASLSFLGLGPPGVSWGEMLNRGRLFVTTSPWQALFGGMAITLAVLAFNLAGDALRDIWDPRLRV